jgi:hypothetical protein
MEDHAVTDSKETTPVIKDGEHPHMHAPAFGVALSETVIDVPASATLATLSFSWPRLFAGGCTLGGNRLDIFDDGTARWQATVMSRNVGEDSWGSRFLFLDNHDVPLWQHGWIWSPTLSPTPIEWISANQIFFGAYIFPHIARVSMSFHC